MSEGRLFKYIGQGAAAARDVTPDIYPSNLVLYWAQDTSELSLYDFDAAAWIEDVLGTGGALIAANNLSDVASAATAWANILQAASASDINTGTNTSKALTSDALAGSNFGVKTVEVLLADPNGSAVTTGDGKAYIRITSDLNGMNLIGCGAVLDTAGTGGGYLLQLRRKRAGSDVDMLSTRISIDSGENDSADAATPPSINASNDDVATGDRIYFDRDGVPTGGKGDTVWMQFQLP